MRKNLVIFAAVTAVSLAAAALGHAYCPQFCMLFKPVTWPFICAGVLVCRSLKAKRERSK